MAMTKEEFRAAIRRHGYTLAEFADDFGVSYDTVRRWGADYSVPRWTLCLLLVMDRYGVWPRIDQGESRR